jgi:heme/copper-type cytochrome/quinol oxidase subunit 2
MVYFDNILQEKKMDDTTDMTTLTIRMLVLVVIAVVFYFVLKATK